MLPGRRLRKIGNPVGHVLPKEALAHLKVEEGDAVTVTDAAEGGLRLSPHKAEVALLAHERSLAQFGGSGGLRDAGLLDSALGKPHNRFAYGRPSLFEPAASYAFGLVKDHPCIDGTKRTGFVVATAFPQLNGWRPEASEGGATVRSLALAAGTMTEAAYADGLKANCRRM